MIEIGRRWWLGLAATLWALGILAPARVAAQTSVQLPLQFDFLNPGAKSMALGGAFAGLADDATATFANPAGLTLLGAPEVSLELRNSHISTDFLERGRLSGTILNEGTDTVQGPEFGQSTGTHFGAGYVAGVYTHPSHRWVVAGYRHELARVDQTFFSQGVFQKDPSEFTSRRDAPQEGLRRVSITGYGVSGSYKVRPDLAVGAGLAIYSFTLDSVFRRFDIDGFLGPPNLNVEFGRSTQQGSDLGVAPTVGLIGDPFPDKAGSGTPPPWYRGRVRVGVVFRKGPSFVMDTQDGGDPLRHGQFRVPNTLAVGASVRVRPQLVIAGEVTRVTYSRLVNDFVVDQAQFTGRQASFGIDDGTELHLGAQYAVTRQNGAPVRLRVGTWYDPDHSVHFTPLQTPRTVADRLFDERLSVALSRGRNQEHVTGGVGLTLTPRLEFNAAVDLARTRTLLSVSLIAHIGRDAGP